MSDSQTIWMILWRHAFQEGGTQSFEISEVVPEVDKALQIDNRGATRLVTGLLKELDRLPAGKQYFRQEGNAIVPLPELSNVPKEPQAEFAAYPYEL
ncbi:MAG: hypothetical protein P4L84_37980 [Isosphaeraceae bacterium]|nr:hypothetical protein [Isosphaeraceae bacterium]